MSSRAPAFATNAPPDTGRDDRIKHWSTQARIAFQRFQTVGDPTGLDLVILAILGDFIPSASKVPLADRTGQTRLIEDLGLDSLAIAEVVFFTEDLFGISIANEEIHQVRTLDDLRDFIRCKVAVSLTR
jgi:acyl carrier protein